MNITLEVARPDALVLWGDYPVLRDWRESLAVPRPGAEYTDAFRTGKWDGMDRPGRFRKLEGRWCLTLGRGWLERVRASFPGAEEVWRSGSDGRAVPLCLDLPDTLRDYQTRTLQLIQDRRWGRVALATNAGKGAVIALAARNAEDARTLILCDEISVYEALRGELEIWAPDEPVALVEAGRRHPPEERVALAMVQTLSRRLDEPGWAEWLDGVEFLMCDEADRSTAKGWQGIMRACPNTHHRIGFSGSFPKPDTVDDRTLEDCMGPVLIRVRNKVLVEREISARPTVELVPFRVRVDDPPRHLTGPEKRRAVYEAGVWLNRERHALIRSLLDPGQPNVVIVDKIAHGEALEEAIPGAVFLQGADSKARRADVMDRFRRGEFDVLIATRILDRGTNLLGHAVGLVLASGEGSRRQVIQRIGRGLRRGGGKEFVYLRDVLDRGQRYLDTASRKRVRVYEGEGFDVEIRET